MAGAGATVEPEPKYGTKVEPEPKINNFGSATLCNYTLRYRVKKYVVNLGYSSWSWGYA